MPVPPGPRETRAASKSGLKLQEDSPVASSEKMKVCKIEPDEAYLPPIVVDFEMEDKAPTSSTVFDKTADGTTGDSSNGNKSSSSRKPSGGKYCDMTKKQLIAHLVLSDEINQAMTKDQQRMTRMESLLHKENERLTKKLADSLQKADAERTRAEDVYEKYSKTTLFNKVGEEGSAQRFFKEKHYEETLQKIKTESDKRVRDLQNELRDSSKECEILTRKLEQAKRPLEKENKDFRSIIRTLSTALEMFVELDGADEKLGLLGESVSQSYKDALKDYRNEPMELDVAKKIAKVDNEEMNEQHP
ncbi:unnamed protein product [Orchesella dallaii]|uniref:Transforming acidic coiled-coil-containing protein C-terminal domain-containing protein n=1 Tax=Orchesella dallaii TaxID=48710 RepID=A0ABP1PIS6_9HEXA